MGRAQKKGKPHTPKAKPAAQGINHIGRSASAHRSGRWKTISKLAAAEKKGGEKAEVKLEKPKASAVAPPVKLHKKTGKPQIPKPTESKWYAADDVSKPIASRKAHAKPTRLRKSITPGTVLIILAGRFQGKRVVFLKQLASGLLLVTGPYKVNGVPLRRINQVYVIATSTRIDIKGVDVKNIDDKFFAKKSVKAAADKKGEFLSDAAKPKYEKLGDARKAAQKAVDAAIIAVVKKTQNMKHYLGAKFSLTKGQAPHAMKF